MKLRKLWLLVLPAFVTTACLVEDGDAPAFINLSVQTLEFSCYAETLETAVETNVSELVVEVSGSAADWCRARLENGTLFVDVAYNQAGSRSAVLTVKGADKTASLELTQAGASIPGTSHLGNNIKIPVSSAQASEAQSGEGIERSYDNNMDTLYHSRWTGTQFPVILTYNFTNVERMDYLLYYPRNTGSNGKFQELEVWTAENNGALQKYGDYNFNGSDGWVTFDPALNKPTKVELRVKSGLGGFASCAEMEFYRKDPQDFDYLGIFTGPDCSELKTGITRAAIDGIPDPFFKDLALKIFLKVYDETGFRIQEYRAWPHPDNQAAENKTAPYSLRDNPTGIWVAKDEALMVFANLQKQNVSLLTQDLSTGGWGTQQTYPLNNGMNKITAKASGLIYVQYYSQQEENAPKLKINFASGNINGYFDSRKHQPEDWQNLLNKAVAPDFDLVGAFAHLTFPVGNFKKFTPDGKALIDKWDEMVRLEHEFMGLYKYNRVYKTRVYCHADYNPESAYMYASSYHTGYSMSALNTGEIISLSKFSDSSVWGPAHEVGHVNQVRPALRWSGMTEVTNNIYSAHVQTLFSGSSKSRLIVDGVYTKAFDNLLGKNRPHNNTETENGINRVDVWVQLVPFWQLKLYLCDALGKTDFYKDLIYYYMTHADPGSSSDTDGRYQLHFVRVACETARLDLTTFFDKWGFLTPVDKSGFKITQEQIDALKAEIAAHNYPKPPRDDFTGITDVNVASYK